MTTILMNPGLIELAAVTTMGISVKEQESAIGYFGTGFKYAIATLLRNGHTVQLLRGEEVFEFTAVAQDVRGKSFQIVHMNGVPLGFSTQLGRNWELWMAFRELYSNMLDEGGEMRIVDQSPGTIQPLPGDTQIIVGGNDFEVVAKGKSSIFLESKPMLKNEAGTVEIHKRPSMKLFYKGVRAYDLKVETPYTYNFLGSAAVLTEDRTIKNLYEPSSKLGMYVTRECADEKFIKDFLLATGVEGSYEAGVDVNWHNPTDTILKVVNQIVRTRGLGALGPSAQALYKKARIEKIQATPVELDELQDAAFTQAQSFLEKLGHRVDKINWSFVRELRDDNTLVEFDTYDKTCKIKLAAFDQGKAKLVQLMFEAVVRINKGVGTYDSPAEVMAAAYVALAQKHLKEYL